MRAVVWIEESTWEACVDQAREVVPADADVMLMHVAPIDVEELAGGGGLLGGFGFGVAHARGGGECCVLRVACCVLTCCVVARILPLIINHKS